MKDPIGTVRKRKQFGWEVTAEFEAAMAYLEKNAKDREAAEFKKMQKFHRAALEEYGLYRRRSRTRSMVLRQARPLGDWHTAGLEARAQARRVEETRASAGDGPTQAGSNGARRHARGGRPDNRASLH